MSGKKQVVNPADLLSSGNIMKARMDDQTTNFQRIVETVNDLSLYGMKSEAGRKVAAKINEISHNAALQRARSEAVASNLQAYADRTSVENDTTASLADAVV